MHKLDKEWHSMTEHKYAKKIINIRSYGNKRISDLSVKARLFAEPGFLQCCPELLTDCYGAKSDILTNLPIKSTIALTEHTSCTVLKLHPTMRTSTKQNMRLTHWMPSMTLNQRGHANTNWLCKSLMLALLFISIQISILLEPVVPLRQIQSSAWSPGRATSKVSSAAGNNSWAFRSRRRSSTSCFQRFSKRKFSVRNLSQDFKKMPQQCLVFRCFASSLRGRSCSRFQSTLCFLQLLWLKKLSLPSFVCNCLSSKCSSFFSKTCWLKAIWSHSLWALPRLRLRLETHGFTVSHGAE